MSEIGIKYYVIQDILTGERQRFRSQSKAAAVLSPGTVWGKGNDFFEAEHDAEKKRQKHLKSGYTPIKWDDAPLEAA